MMRLAGRGEDGTAKAIKTSDDGRLKTATNEKFVITAPSEIFTDSEGNAVLMDKSNRPSNLSEFKKLHVEMVSYTSNYSLIVYDHRTGLEEDYGTTSLIGKTVLAYEEQEKRIKREISSFSDTISIRFESSNLSRNSIQYLKIWGEK